MGVSVEDRKYGLPRIDDLRASPAAIRFLSIEPLLEDLGNFDLCGIHWTIVGGESGHGARPMLQEWVERIQRLCEVHNVHFFFKQWGGLHKSKTGRLLHGTTHDAMPGRVVAPFASRKDRLKAASACDMRATRWKALDLVPLHPAMAAL